MPQNRLSNVIGIDDAPFEMNHQGPVQIVGAVYAGLRFDGVLLGAVEKDGSDATDAIADLITSSKFRDHIQLIMLQGITLAGFNVVDAQRLFETAQVPVLVVSRRKPDMAAIRRALLTRIAGGAKKWERIAQLGKMEPLQHIFVQRIGLSKAQALSVVTRFAVHSHIPEPIRTAHLIAGALCSGQSRGNP
jgi:endonuclease V-like protein UPF0215 family